MASYDLVWYQFSREKVVRKDFQHFLSLYGEEMLPIGRPLADLANTFVLSVTGWGTDPREVYEIPEVREFYEAFWNRWPYLLYFACLETDELRMVVFSCLPTFVAQADPKQRKVKITYDPKDLTLFLVASFPAMNSMFARAGLGEKEVFARTGALCQYFGLPWDEGS